jgi:hypothetical protein
MSSVSYLFPICILSICHCSGPNSIGLEHLRVKTELAKRSTPINQQEYAHFLQVFRQDQDSSSIVLVRYAQDLYLQSMRKLIGTSWLCDESLSLYMSMCQVRDSAKVHSYNLKNSTLKKLKWEIEPLYERDNPVLIGCPIDYGLYGPGGSGAITENCERRPSHYFSSLFMAKLLTQVQVVTMENGREVRNIIEQGYDFSLVQRWTKKFDPFQLDKVFMPTNIGHTHWVLTVVFVQRQEIHVYDSDRYEVRKYAEAALRWLKDVAADRKHPFNASNWKIITEFNFAEVSTILESSGNSAYAKEREDQGLSNRCYVPKQANGYDCGVYCCMFTDIISDDLPLFSCLPSSLPEYRKKIACDSIRKYISY